MESGESNAWERAQEAISRAEERDGTVVTPDNAVSPYDASATTVIALPSRGGRSAPVQPGRPGPALAPLTPRPPGPPAPRRADEPPTAPVEVSDPQLVPVAVGGDDDTAVTEDLGAARGGEPGSAGSGRVSTPRPPTAPFAAAPAEEPDVAPAATTTTPRRSWWKRWFGRR